ncbi:MAG: TIGR04282 family arsenosugar biosynthesis glycosyltransferase [Hyphomicrobiales bacterium]|nr:TIGR04282 family arsenosugar biosynthesis glycosyltransferase [Hyphomicrobiales bacterium]MDE2114866.1 TIGR04282 family arsenosugar biosynthesis glycosyltransferase [Hyphomicrobiales bacterium]
MPEPEAAIGVICKAPRVGASKTRLIPALGPEFAAQLSRCFLIDLAASIEAVATDIHAKGYMVFAPAEAEAELRAFMPTSFGALCQQHAGLGTVLARSTQDLLDAGHDCVLLVNGDSPTLPASLMTEAILALRQPGERVVFGPALDGGYYLIGLKRAHLYLFEEIAWSTPQVLAQSIQRANLHQLPVVRLAPWYDVDEAQSLDWLRKEILGEKLPFLDRIGSPAQATRALLQSLNPGLQTLQADGVR